MEERKRGRRGRGRKVEGVMEEGKEREVEREKGGGHKRGVREGAKQ